MSAEEGRTSDMLESEASCAGEAKGGAELKVRGLLTNW